MEKRNYNQLDKPADNKEAIFGIRPVIEAIKSGKEIEKLLVQKDQHSLLIQELIKLAREYNIHISYVPVQKLDSITRKNHQGVICFISAIVYSSLDNIITACFQKGKIPLVLILDRVTDVRNFGGIARTAECTGVDAIVIPSRGSAQINSDALKTSAGALNFIPVCREDNLKNTITYLKESGLQIVGCTEKTEKFLYEFDFKTPVAIIMGSEEDGISPEYLKRCDATVKVPMQGKIESLNVSVATGMILYEVVRQRKM
jgi:23S rRNA (guanosine2251-2'-O)-methyltransferase